MSRTTCDMESLKSDFTQRGYAILKNFLPCNVLDSARADIARLVDRLADDLLRKGLVADPLQHEPFETRLFNLYRFRPKDAPKIFKNELHSAGMYPLFFHQPLLDVVEHLLGSNELRLFPNYAVRPKLPNNNIHEVPWHQDTAYSYYTNWFASKEVSVDEAVCATSRMVNVWVPLVPATTQNGCMQFIPKSHLSGMLPHEEDEHYLKIKNDAMKDLLSLAVDIELNCGDLVLFNQLLVHQGLRNQSDHVRWSSDFRYQDAAMPTLRKEKGHMARSVLHPSKVVLNAEHWTRLELGGPNEPIRM